MNRIIFPYDESFYPPFPALPVVIQNSEIGAQTAVITALLDSGGDIVLGRNVLSKIRLRSSIHSIS